MDVVSEKQIEYDEFCSSTRLSCKPGLHTSSQFHSHGDEMRWATSQHPHFVTDNLRSLVLTSFCTKFRFLVIFYTCFVLDPRINLYLDKLKQITNYFHQRTLQQVLLNRSKCTTGKNKNMRRMHSSRMHTDCCSGCH